MSRVLFVCVHNAGRSQMAEAFYNQLVRERGMDSAADSAGTEPGDRLHPEVVTAMRQAGFDLSDKRPRLLTNRLVDEADRIITMGCAPDAAACPAILVRRVEDWALPDPHGQPLERVLEIRDEILRRVERLVEELEQVSAHKVDGGTF